MWFKPPDGLPQPCPRVTIRKERAGPVPGRAKKERAVLAEHRIFKARFSDIYPLYVQKALRKGRTQDEVDAVILWLTGYTPGGLARQLAQRTDMASFFGQAPRFNPAGAEIKGVVCGVRVEDIEDPLMQKIRYLDKLIDELAKGRPMAKILRGTKDGGEQC